MDCECHKSETDCEELLTTTLSLTKPSICSDMYRHFPLEDLIVGHKPIVMSCEGHNVTML